MKGPADIRFVRRPVGVKPGDRMTLVGKRKQSGNTLVFETYSATKDFGACPP
jgi:hypothetical protein